MELDPDDVESILERPSEGAQLEELLRQREAADETSTGRGATTSGSGVFELAQMVARVSIDQIKRPSIPPKPHDELSASPAAARVPEAFPLEVTTTDMPPSIAPAPSQRRVLVPIFASMGAVFVLAIAVILVLQSRQDRAAREAEAAKVALLREAAAQMAARSEPTPPRAEPQAPRATPPRAEEAAAPTAPAADESRVQADAVAPSLDSADEEDSGEKAKRAQKHKRKGHRRRGAKRGSSERTNGGGDLDALVGAGATKAPQIDGASGVPSREQLNAAMAPVVRRASSCASHATGTVQLKVTIAGNGGLARVKSVGGFANTPVGGCVEALAKSAKFPKFEESLYTFTYSVTVR